MSEENPVSKQGRPIVKIKLNKPPKRSSSGSQVSSSSSKLDKLKALKTKSKPAKKSRNPFKKEVKDQKSNTLEPVTKTEREEFENPQKKKGPQGRWGSFNKKKKKDI